MVPFYRVYVFRHGFAFFFYFINSSWINGFGQSIRNKFNNLNIVIDVLMYYILNQFKIAGNNVKLFGSWLIYRDLQKTAMSLAVCFYVEGFQFQLHLAIVVTKSCNALLKVKHHYILIISIRLPLNKKNYFSAIGETNNWSYEFDDSPHNVAHNDIKIQSGKDVF